MTSVSSTAYLTASRYASGQSSKAGQEAASNMDVYDRAQDRSASSSARGFDSRPSGATASFHGLLAEKLTIDLSTCQKIDPLALPEADYQVFMEQERRLVFIEKLALEEKYTAEPVMPDLSNEPRLKAYANVVVGGTVVATIDNQGIVGSRSDEISRRLTAMLTDGLASKAKSSGPTLAQDRANSVAALLGGTVEKSATAMTQGQYDALPPLTAPERVIDMKAMMADPLYATLEQTSARIQEIEASRARSMESFKA